MGQVTDNDGETDDCECSECLGTHQQDVEAGNGTAWVKCGCGQWIHDECVYQSAIGEDGKERMCSNCVVRIAVAPDLKYMTYLQYMTSSIIAGKIQELLV